MNISDKVCSDDVIMLHMSLSAVTCHKCSMHVSMVLLLSC